MYTNSSELWTHLEKVCNFERKCFSGHPTENDGFFRWMLLDGYIKGYEIV